LFAYERFAVIVFDENTVASDMSDYETYECNACGESFAAHEDSNAARNGYCSPRCQTAG